ncbi:hypothetical protein WJX74_008205 [Apatococcus lobatus]|uniref:HNH nuclease domain-containing protein n=1 Tax=Apatococcus lobatus TaxID=904363 RepID=A0AAW1RZA3_9CHLO
MSRVLEASTALQSAVLPHDLKSKAIASVDNPAYSAREQLASFSRCQHQHGCRELFKNSFSRIQRVGSPQQRAVRRVSAIYAASNQYAALDLSRAAESLGAFIPLLQALSMKAAGLQIKSRRSMSSAKRKALADDFKLRLYRYYINPDAAIYPSQLTCMVTGLQLPANLILAAHLIPDSELADAAAFWDVGDLDAERNGVLWAAPIEKAWHRQEIAFIADSQGQLIFTVLTESLMTTPLQHLKWDTTDCETYNFKTFGNFDGVPLAVTPNAMPHTQAFLNQAVSAVTFFSKGQRLRKGIFLDPSTYKVASDFPNKPDIQRWLCAMLPVSQNVGSCRDLN